MSAYRGLGFDPVPGDPDAAVAAAGGFVAAAEALGRVEPAVRRAREATGGWAGAAAESFAVAVGRVPSDVDDRAERLRRAAEVLSGWAGVLGGNRRAAADLDEEARKVRGRISAAEDDVHAARNNLDLAATPAAAAVAGMDHATAESTLAALRSRLDEVLGAARALAEEHQRTASAAAAELDALRGVSAPAGPVAARGVVSVLDGLSGTTAALARLFSPAGGSGVRPTGAAGAFAGALVPAQASRETIVLVEAPTRGPRR